MMGAQVIAAVSSGAIEGIATAVVVLATFAFTGVRIEREERARREEKR